MMAMFQKPIHQRYHHSGTVVKAHVSMTTSRKRAHSLIRRNSARIWLKFEDAYQSYIDLNEEELESLRQTLNELHEATKDIES